MQPQTYYQLKILTFVLLLLVPSRGLNWYTFGFDDPDGCDTEATSFDNDQFLLQGTYDLSMRYTYADDSIVIGGTTYSKSMLGTFVNNNACLPRPIPFIHYYKASLQEEPPPTLFFTHRVAKSSPKGIFSTIRSVKFMQPWIDLIPNLKYSKVSYSISAVIGIETEGGVSEGDMLIIIKGQTQDSQFTKLNPMAIKASYYLDFLEQPVSNVGFEAAIQGDTSFGLFFQNNEFAETKDFNIYLFRSLPGSQISIHSPMVSDFSLIGMTHSRYVKSAIIFGGHYNKMAGQQQPLQMQNERIQVTAFDIMGTTSKYFDHPSAPQYSFKIDAVQQTQDDLYFYLHLLCLQRNPDMTPLTSSSKIMLVISVILHQNLNMDQATYRAVAYKISDLPMFVRLLSLSQTTTSDDDPLYSDSGFRNQYLLYVGSNTEETLGQIGDAQHSLRVDRILSETHFDVTTHASGLAVLKYLNANTYELPRINALSYQQFYSISSPFAMQNYINKYKSMQTGFICYSSTQMLCQVIEAKSIFSKKTTYSGVIVPTPNHYSLLNVKGNLNMNGLTSTEFQSALLDPLATFKNGKLWSEAMLNPTHQNKFAMVMSTFNFGYKTRADQITQHAPRVINFSTQDVYMFGSAADFTSLQTISTWSWILNNSTENCNNLAVTSEFVSTGSYFVTLWDGTEAQGGPAKGLLFERDFMLIQKQDPSSTSICPTIVNAQQSSSQDSFVTESTTHSIVYNPSMIYLLTSDQWLFYFEQQYNQCTRFFVGFSFQFGEFLDMYMINGNSITYNEGPTYEISGLGPIDPNFRCLTSDGLMLGNVVYYYETNTGMYYYSPQQEIDFISESLNDWSWLATYMNMISLSSGSPELISPDTPLVVTITQPMIVDVTEWVEGFTIDLASFISNPNDKAFQKDILILIDDGGSTDQTTPEGTGGEGTGGSEPQELTLQDMFPGYQELPDVQLDPQTLQLTWNKSALQPLEKALIIAINGIDNGGFDHQVKKKALNLIREPILFDINFACTTTIITHTIPTSLNLQQNMDGTQQLFQATLDTLFTSTAVSEYCSIKGYSIMDSLGTELTGPTVFGKQLTIESLSPDGSADIEYSTTIADGEPTPTLNKYTITLKAFTQFPDIFAQASIDLNVGCFEETSVELRPLAAPLFQELTLPNDTSIAFALKLIFGQGVKTFNVFQLVELTETPQYNCFSLELRGSEDGTLNETRIGITLTENAALTGIQASLSVDTSVRMFNRKVYLRATPLVGVPTDILIGSISVIGSDLGLIQFNFTRDPSGEVIGNKLATYVSPVFPKDDNSSDLTIAVTSANSLKGISWTFNPNNTLSISINSNDFPDTRSAILSISLTQEEFVANYQLNVKVNIIKQVQQLSVIVVTAPIIDSNNTVTDNTTSQVTNTTNTTKPISSQDFNDIEIKNDENEAFKPILPSDMLEEPEYVDLFDEEYVPQEPTIEYDPEYVYEYYKETDPENDQNNGEKETDEYYETEKEQPYEYYKETDPENDQNNGEKDTEEQPYEYNDEADLENDQENGKNETDESIETEEELPNEEQEFKNDDQNSIEVGNKEKNQSNSSSNETATEEPVVDENNAAKKLEQYKEEQAKIQLAREKQRLKQLGFQKTKFGITFPNVNVTAMSLLRQPDVKEVPPPEIKIGALSVEGEVKVEFNQDFIAPSKVDQNVYKNVIEVSIKSSVDGTISYGRVGAQGRRLRAGNRKLVGDDSENKVAFYVEISGHDPQGMGLKLHWDDPDKVSQGAKDEFKVDFKELSLFQSAVSGQKAQLDGSQITKVCPPQVKDPAQVAMIENQVESAGTALSFLSSGNFVITLLMAGSLQQLWGMIRALQMVILICLVKIEIPAHTLVFFQQSITVSQMDVFYGEYLTDTFLTFIPTDPLNENFELFGLGNKNFMLSAGSYFILQSLIILQFLLSKLICRICANYAHNERARAIGTYFYQPDGFRIMKVALKKLWLESYFDLSFCSILNAIQIYESYKEGNIMLHFTLSRPNDLFCSLATIFYGIGLIGFPLYGLGLINLNFNDLHRSSMLKNHGYWYADLNTKSRLTANYNIIFLVRRLLTTVTLVFWDVPFFQATFLLVISTINFIYTTVVNPFDTKKANIIECFNEFTILLSLYAANLFLDLRLPSVLKNKLGWFTIGCSVLNIGVNMAILVHSTLKNVRLSVQHKHNTYKAKLAIQKKYEERKFLIQTHNSKTFPSFEEEQYFHKKLDKIMPYGKQRVWMTAMDVDFSEFPEEKEFQMGNRVLKLEQRASRVRFTKAAIYAASKKAAEEYQQYKVSLNNNNNNNYNNQEQKAAKLQRLPRKQRTQKLKLPERDLSIIKENVDGEQIEESIISSEGEMRLEELIKVKNSRLLNDFVPIVNHFNFNEKEKLAKLNKVDIVKNQRLQQVLELEEKDYGLTEDANVQKVAQDIEKETHNMQILLAEVDEEDYGDEVYNELYNKSDKALMHYYKTQHPKVLDDRLENSSLVAAFQILASIPEFVSKVVNNDHTGKPFCQAFKQTLNVLYRNKFLALNRKVESIEDFKVFLKNNAQNQDPFENAQDLLQWLVNALGSEQPDLLQMFTTKIKNESMCKMGHNISFEHTKTISWLKSNITMQKQLEKEFNSNMQPSQMKGKNCPKCNATLFMQNSNKIIELPLMLVFNIEIFVPAEGELIRLHENLLYIPEELDLKNFVDKTFKPKSSTKYKICSSILHRGGVSATDGEFLASLKNQDAWMDLTKEGPRSSKKELGKDNCVFVYKLQQ